MSFIYFVAIIGVCYCVFLVLRLESDGRKDLEKIVEIDNKRRAMQSAKKRSQRKFKRKC